MRKGEREERGETGERGSEGERRRNEGVEEEGKRRGDNGEEI
jgi:hypothetical protein